MCLIQIGGVVSGGHMIQDGGVVLSKHTILYG
jgi:hypothetical protein